MLVVRHNVEGEVRTNQLVCGEIPKSLRSIPLQQAGRECSGDFALRKPPTETT